MTATRTPGRHRAQQVPGPVTAAMAVIGKPRGRAAELALRAWPALPALALARCAMHRELAGYADAVLGYDALLCLLACLAVTPFLTAAKLRIAKLRWWYGIWVFVLGFAGLMVHLLAMPGAYAARASGNAASWSGLLIVVLLAPMAATSTAVAQKALGTEWKTWQRGLIWAVAAVTLAHLLTIRDWLTAAAYAAAMVPLIVMRIPRVRRSVKQWRGNRYDTRGLWVTLAILCTVLAAGVTVLLAREGASVASAIRLA